MVVRIHLPQSAAVAQEFGHHFAIVGHAGANPVSRSCQGESEREREGESPYHL